MYRPLLISSLLFSTSCSLVTQDPVNSTPTASPSQVGNLVTSSSVDIDNDNLNYSWSLVTTGVVLSSSENFDITPYIDSYDGIQTVRLTVSDSQSSNEYFIAVDFGKITSTPSNNPPTANPLVFNDVYSANATDLDSDPISYSWNITSTGALLSSNNQLDINTFTQTYAGEQSVTLTVSDTKDSNSYLLTVDFGEISNDASPIASFTSSQVNAIIVNNQAVNVTFNASNSSDDNGIASYNWSIDTKNYSGTIIAHSFTQPGTYPVTLTVTDTAGQSNASSINFIVSDENNIPDDQVVANSDKAIGTTGEIFTFDSTGSTLFGQDYSYSWDINNQTFNSESVELSFAVKGTYVATLSVTNNTTNETSQDIISVNIANPIDASISTASTSVQLNSQVSFTPSNPDNDYTTYSWNIDGSIYNTQNADHAFDSLGSATATLTITNNLGLTQSETINLNVIDNTAQPSISIVSNEDLTIELDVQFDSNPTAYQWNIDGTLYSTKMVTHTFTEDGTYNISLSANYGSGFDLHDSTTVTVSAINDGTSICNLTTGGDPYCNAHFFADTDGDGWGIENNTSCVYINGAADPDPGSCKDGNNGDDYTGIGQGLSALTPFPIGLAIPDGTGTSGVSILNNSIRQNILTSDFSQITLENKMKMSYIEFNFNEADAIVNWADQNGLGVHGHALVWHHHSQLPTWAENPTADFKQDFVDSITRTASHYAGKVYSWDVVNEALYDEYDGTGHTDNNGLRNSVYFNQYNGSEYIHEAFRAARAADPNAILYYNDFSTENNLAKTTALVNLIQELLDNDVPIDGVGFQMHVVNSWPNVSQIRTSMQKIVDLDPNLMIKITELDVRINNVYDGDDTNDFVNRDDCLGENSCTGLAAQKARYKEIIEAYLDVVPPHRRGGISIWGVADLDSWLYENNGPNNTPDWPLLFDDNFDKKPAFYGIEEVMLDLASFN